MAGRTPPSGFYAYQPPSGSRLHGTSLHPPPPPPPPPPHSSQGASSTFAYNYNYSSANAALPSYQETTITKPPSTTVMLGANVDGRTAEDEMWRCDACDISLKSERALKNHKRSHVKCTECDFEGVPKAVKGHYEARHGRFSRSGFKTVTVAIPGCRVQRFRICVGNRPEDIKQWIADRKKRFPRQQASKSAAVQQPADKRKKTTAVVADTTGLSSMLAGYGSSSASEDENVDDVDKKQNVQETISEPKTTSPGMQTIDNENKSLTQTANKRLCRFFMRNGSCKNGDGCRFRHEQSNNPTRSPGRGAKRQKRGKSSSNDTLLRKLLSSDMERESSLAMQLLGFIVDSNFFEVGEKTSPNKRKQPG